jgi:HEAT repeat protein
MEAMQAQTLTRRQRKERAVRLLDRRRTAEIREWARQERNAMELLFMLTYVRDDTMRMRALEALSITSAVVAEQDLEAVRDRLRRLVWAMNHESGNVPWHAPDAAGEILAGAPVLIEEFGRIVASFIGLEPFVHGVHRAVARMSEADPGPVSYLEPYLVHATSSPDPVIRAHAARALIHIDPRAHRPRLVGLADDEETFMAYDRQTGRARTTSVGGFVRDLLD